MKNVCSEAEKLKMDWNLPVKDQDAKDTPIRDSIRYHYSGKRILARLVTLSEYKSV